MSTKDIAARVGGIAGLCFLGSERRPDLSIQEATRFKNFGSCPGNGLPLAVSGCGAAGSPRTPWSFCCSTRTGRDRGSLLLHRAHRA